MLNKRTLVVTVLSCGFCSSTALAASLESFPPPAVYIDPYPTGMSADGAVVAATLSDPITYAGVAVEWVNGSLQILQGPAGASNTTIGVSPDGHTIVGTTYSSLVGYKQGIRWDNGVYQILPNLPGLTGDMQAYGASSHGTTIVGTLGDGFSYAQAISWNNGTAQGLGYLPGDTFSQAIAVSADGNIIAGASHDASSGHAVRWVNGNIQALDNLPGSVYAVGEAISADGSVIGGIALGNNYSYQAVKWVGTNVTLLQPLPGSAYNSVNAINGNGTVIVGVSSDTNTTYAVRWVNNQPAEKIIDALAAKNVNVTGWSLSSATGVNRTGDLITGSGYENGTNVAFLANLATGGLTTPGALEQSLSTVTQTGQQVVSITGAQLDQVQFQSRNLILPRVFTDAMKQQDEAALPLDTRHGTAGLQLFEMYATGSFGTGQNNDFANNEVNGTVGIKSMVSRDVAVGAGVVASSAYNQLAFAGHSRIGALGVSAVASYAPHNAPLRMYGSVFGSSIDLDMTRGYENGAGLDSSKGSTDGYAYGTAGEVGWNIPVVDRYSVMPYVGLSWSKTSLDGYAETGGAFAASLGSQNTENSTARLGVENDYALTPTLDLVGRANYAHRLQGNSASVTADVSGLTQTLGAETGDRDWAEASVSLGWQMDNQTYITGELNGRAGNTPEPAISAIAGVSVKF